MKLGIVGLPNVGKSTLFNSMTLGKAEAANYPFCTIDPNVGVVPVPDERLARLTEMYDSAKTTPAVIEFVDIAGLVRGASKGEGLGNKFLSHIREVDAICHVVRCFEDTNVIHVDGSVDPVRDIETINLELIFSDIEILDRRISKIAKQAKMDKTYAKELELLEEYILSGRDIASNEKIEKHATWVAEFLPKYEKLDKDNIQEVLRREVGNVFVHVLEDAGVYKCTPEGRDAFMRFINTL